MADAGRHDADARRTSRGSPRGTDRGHAPSRDAAIAAGDLVAFDGRAWSRGGYVGELGRTARRRRRRDASAAALLGSAGTSCGTGCSPRAGPARPATDLLDAYDAAGVPAAADAGRPRARPRQRPAAGDATRCRAPPPSSGSRPAWCSPSPPTSGRRASARCTARSRSLITDDRPGAAVDHAVPRCRGADHVTDADVPAARGDHPLREGPGAPGSRRSRSTGPDQLNVPTIGARRRYGDLIFKASIDDDVKVLVVRGVGDHLGTAPTSTSSWRSASGGTALQEEFGIDRRRRRHDAGPARSYRNGASLAALVRRPAVGLPQRSQDFKKISILEVKGYCYGWHFYQAADADLVISSDDALFGHPAFRYVGYAPRMWQWAMMMGLRKFQEMVFTGRPFTAQEMYDCNFVNSVVPRDELEAEVEKYALACAHTRPTDTVFMQKVFFEIMKQHQGEYMGSMLSAWLESMGGAARATTSDNSRGQARRKDRRWTRAQQRWSRTTTAGSRPSGGCAGRAARRRTPNDRVDARRRWPGSGSSTCRPGSPAPTARSCSPTAAPRSSRSSPRTAIRCVGGRRRARRSPTVRTARCSTSSHAGKQTTVVDATADELADAARPARRGRRRGLVARLGGRRASRPRPAALLRAHPHLTVTAITPFGLEGPWADKPATEFTLQAWSGGDRSGSAAAAPDRAPVHVGGQIGEWLAGAYAAIGTLASLRRGGGAASSSTSRCSRRWRCA